MKCLICGKEIGAGEQTYKFIPGRDDSQICILCMQRYGEIKQKGGDKKDTISEKSYEVLQQYVTDISDEEVKAKLQDALSMYKDEEAYAEKEAKILQDRQEAKAKYEEEQKLKDMFNHELFMTTANSIEGYRVVKQCGLVFGDTLFKASLLDSVVSTIKDIGNALSFSAKEMSGSMYIIDNARSFALDKMEQDAKDRGANAIIAIDSETVYGSGITQITVSGTAVYVEPIL